MKEPAWVKVVGIMGIIMGCFGLLGAWSIIMTPKMIEMQKEMMPQIQEMMEAQPGSTEATMAVLEKMWNAPEWFGTWCFISGTMSFLIAGYYILACVNLLRVKKSAINMFYTATGISLVFTVIKVFVSTVAISYMGMPAMIGVAIGIGIHIVLLVTVANGNKEMFLEA